MRQIKEKFKRKMKKRQIWIRTNYFPPGGKRKQIKRKFKKKRKKGKRGGRMDYFPRGGKEIRRKSCGSPKRQA